MSTSTATPKTIAFLGASAGVGLSALKHALRSGHTCIALCRNPARLTSALPSPIPANLTIIEGNAHDQAAVSKCIRAAPSSTTLEGLNYAPRFVDVVLSSIGAKPQMKLGKPFMDDAEVCQKGMHTLLSSISSLRTDEGLQGHPHIIAVSTTGISKAGRDVPMAFVPMYKVGLKVPHIDKEIMEDRLVKSGERWTIVRCSLLMGGESETRIRVMVEDADKGVVEGKKEIGYTISREDAGRWIKGEVIEGGKYEGKVASITY